MARTNVGQGNSAVFASCELGWFSSGSLDKVDVAGQLSSVGTHGVN